MTPIHDFLTAYAAKDYERCHMPGHKSGIDLTEIDGAINIIYESERFAADLFGAKRTLFSCSGSTLAIFAMLSPFANKRVAVIGNPHRSFVDAAILLDFEIVRIVGTPYMVSADTDAIFATNIDYYGRQACLADFVGGTVNIPLLTDNAHGAYLVFTDSHPIKLGAAMCADSAHKTLPALTGAAYLHFSDTGSEFIRSAKAGLALLGTSSPSYLIYNSLDLCNKHIAEEKHIAEAGFEAVAKLKQDLAETGYTLNKTDLLRITIDVNAYGYLGRDFALKLREQGVVCEMYDSRYVILLFSTITQEKNTQRVFESMRKIPKKPAFAGKDIVIPQTKQALSARQAYFSPKRTIPIREAVGEVCAGVHVPIPPCVPVIFPGEVVTHEIVMLLENSDIHEIDVISR